MKKKKKLSREKSRAEKVIKINPIAIDKSPGHIIGLRITITMPKINKAKIKLSCSIILMQHIVCAFEHTLTHTSTMAPSITSTYGTARATIILCNNYVNCYYFYSLAPDVMARW